MAIYLNTETQEYPRHDGDLELLGWSVGNDLPDGWVEVEYVDPPELEDGQTYEQLAPVEVDGVWRMSWQVRNLTESEKKEIAVREIRAKVQNSVKITAEEAALLID